MPVGHVAQEQGACNLTEAIHSLQRSKALAAGTEMLGRVRQNCTHCTDGHVVDQHDCLR